MKKYGNQRNQRDETCSLEKSKILNVVHKQRYEADEIISSPSCSVKKKSRLCTDYKQHIYEIEINADETVPKRDEDQSDHFLFEASNINKKFIGEAQHLLCSLKLLGTSDNENAKKTALKLCRLLKSVPDRSANYDSFPLSKLISVFEFYQKEKNEKLIFLLSVSLYLLCRDTSMFKQFLPSFICYLFLLLSDCYSPKTVELDRDRKNIQFSSFEYDPIVFQSKMLLDRLDVKSWGLQSRQLSNTADLLLHVLYQILENNAGRIHHNNTSNTALKKPEKSNLNMIFDGKKCDTFGKSKNSVAECEHFNFKNIVEIQEYLRQNGCIESLCKMFIEVVEELGNDTGRRVTNQLSTAPDNKINPRHLLQLLKLLELATLHSIENSVVVSRRIIESLSKLFDLCHGCVYDGDKSLCQIFPNKKNCEPLPDVWKKYLKSFDLLLEIILLLINLTHMTDPLVNKDSFLGCVLLLVSSFLIGNRKRNGRSVLENNIVLNDQLHSYGSIGLLYKRRESLCCFAEPLHIAEETCKFEVNENPYFFDLQVLSLTALTNCIELPTSIESRRSLYNLTVCEGCSIHPSFSLILHSPEPREFFDDRGFHERCEAVPFPEYLVQQFVAQFAKISNTVDPNISSLEKDEPALSFEDTYLSRSEADECILTGYLGLFIGCMYSVDTHFKEKLSTKFIGNLIDSVVFSLKVFLNLHHHARILSKELAIPVCKLIRKLEGVEECGSGYENNFAVEWFRRKAQMIPSLKSQKNEGKSSDKKVDTSKCPDRSIATHFQKQHSIKSKTRRICRWKNTSVTEFACGEEPLMDGIHGSISDSFASRCQNSEKKCFSNTLKLTHTSKSIDQHPNHNSHFKLEHFDTVALDHDNIHFTQSPFSQFSVFGNCSQQWPDDSSLSFR